MTNAERIQAEIGKQINAGFNADEIRQNLLVQQFSTAEINEGLRKMPAATAPQKSTHKFGILSVLVSVWFIINGSMRLANNRSDSFLHTWGIILICVGSAGLFYKAWTGLRK